MGHYIIFLLRLIPRRGAPSSNYSALVFVPEGATDLTLPILRRILQNDEFIADFIQATATHLRHFHGSEAESTALIIGKIWNWAAAFKEDPLCSRFLDEIRTSVPFWTNLFEASLGSLGSTKRFEMTLCHHAGDLTNCLVHHRYTASEAEAVTKLLVSTRIFDALEASLGEVLRHGTQDDQFELCSTSSPIRRIS